MDTVIGRQKEQESFQRILSSKQAEFVAVYGRRRVGKTYLIENFFSSCDTYMACSGIKDGSTHDQLLNFMEGFKKTFYPHLPLSTPTNWRAALELLTQEITKISSHKKIILFFDELPWLAKRKSKLLQNIDYFWNTHWRKMPNVKLIVCGSAASWMLEKLINAKGGLHNRITRSLLIEPFTLSETREFLHTLGVMLTEKQVLDLYMVTGGVPFYLTQLQKSKSLAHNIQSLCFQKEGLLYAEFPRLFNALFDMAQLNLQIIREIAKHRYGIAFSDLIKKTGKKVGGRFKKRLAELEAAGFIQSFLPYGRKKRDHFYKVIDEYTLFYLKWIEPIAEGQSVPKGVNYWLSLSKTPGWLSWAGYAFEGICYKHIDKIIHTLGLDSVACLIGHWRHTPVAGSSESGAQIDLLLDRQDDAITLCEIKYTQTPFTIDKSYARQLMTKVDVFKQHFSSTKQIFTTLITTAGLKSNLWSKELIEKEVRLKDLF